MSKKDKISAGSIQFGALTRLEEIKIGIELDYDKFQQVAGLIEQLCGWMPPTRMGDIVKFDYAFAIEYFGQVEENLNRVLTILGQAETAVVSVDSELIDGASCLIARVAEKLRQIQTMVAPREA